MPSQMPVEYHSQEDAEAIHASPQTSQRGASWTISPGPKIALGLENHHSKEKRGADTGRKGSNTHKSILKEKTPG